LDIEHQACVGDNNSLDFEMAELKHEFDDEKPPRSHTSGDSEASHENNTEFAPINASSTGARITRPNSRQGSTLSRQRSSNGYGVGDFDDNLHDVEGGEAAVEKDPYEVRWEDGDDDPMSPRSTAHGKKWLIVLIVSASSFCV
jgi:hypothetical protein